MMAQVPAAERTMAVLRHFATQARPVAAAAIARDLGLPRSSTYHLLTTLAGARFVTHYPEPGGASACGEVAVTASGRHSICTARSFKRAR